MYVWLDTEVDLHDIFKKVSEKLDNNVNYACKNKLLPIATIVKTHSS